MVIACRWPGPLGRSGARPVGVFSMRQPKIETLGGFVNRVSEIREKWGIDNHKELWFPGEGEKHE
jgi:hypothetical protein